MSPFGKEYWCSNCSVFIDPKQQEYLVWIFDVITGKYYSGLRNGVEAEGLERVKI